MKSTSHMKYAHTTCRADSRFAPCQWETALLCNDVSHWLGACLESTLTQWSTIAVGMCNIVKLWKWKDDKQFGLKSLTPNYTLVIYKFINISCVTWKIFQANQVNIMAIDYLALCVTCSLFTVKFIGSLAKLELTLCTKLVSVCNDTVWSGYNIVQYNMLLHTV